MVSLIDLEGQLVSLRTDMRRAQPAPGTKLTEDQLAEQIQAEMRNAELVAEVFAS